MCCEAPLRLCVYIIYVFEPEWNFQSECNAVRSNEMNYCWVNVAQWVLGNRNSCSELPEQDWIVKETKVFTQKQGGKIAKVWNFCYFATLFLSEDFRFFYYPILLFIFQLLVCLLHPRQTNKKTSSFSISLMSVPSSSEGIVGTVVAKSVQWIYFTK